MTSLLGRRVGVSQKVTKSDGGKGGSKPKEVVDSLDEHNTVPPPVRIFIPLRSPSYTYGYKIRLQKFDFNKNISINLLHSPQKENLPKVNLKVQKGHGFTFSLKLSQLDPYIQP